MQNNNKLHLIGYSGHSYVCIEAALENNFDILGYFELEEKLYNPYNLIFLGQGVDADNASVFIAIGNNMLRKKVYANLPSTCDTGIVLIHPNAYVSKTANIEEQVVILNGSQVNAQVIIKKGVIINTNAVVEHECQIGKFSHIAPGALLLGNVKIGCNVFVGAGSIIKQGLIICDNVTIGMSAVVTKDITEPGTYIGAPAVRIK